MTKNTTINSYKELMAEKERLQLLFSEQKKAIGLEAAAIKAEIKPVTSAISMVGSLFNRNKSIGIINQGLDVTVDWLLKKVLLRRSGWLTKMIAPFLVKNIASHLLAKKLGTSQDDDEEEMDNDAPDMPPPAKPAGKYKKKIV